MGLDLLLIMLTLLVAEVVLAEQELMEYFLAFKAPQRLVALAEQDILGHILATHMVAVAADQYSLFRQTQQDH